MLHFVRWLDKMSRGRGACPPPLGQSVPAGTARQKSIPVYHPRREMGSPSPLPVKPKKAPVILTRKMASAGWWVPYSVFDMGKAQPICRAYKIIYPCIPSTIHSSTISQKFISYLGCRLLNHNVALQLSQSDKSTATYPPIPEPNIPKVVGR